MSITEVTEKVKGSSISVEDFQGTITEIILTLQDAKMSAEAQGYYDIEIVMSYNDGYHDFELRGTRKETPAEKERRKRRQAKKRELAAKRKKEKEQKEYEELL